MNRRSDRKSAGVKRRNAQSTRRVIDVSEGRLNGENVDVLTHVALFNCGQQVNIYKKNIRIWQLPFFKN